MALHAGDQIRSPASFAARRDTGVVILIRGPSIAAPMEPGRETSPLSGPTTEAQAAPVVVPEAQLRDRAKAAKLRHKAAKARVKAERLADRSQRLAAKAQAWEQKADALDGAPPL